MHFHGLDLNLLVTLDALLKEKNVTRAADRLFISQPAVSGALNKLRHHFSDPLLERVGRNMELTPKAKALREPLTDILALIESTVSRGPTFDPQTDRRVFNIGMSGYCAEVFGVPFVKKLLETSNRVSVHFMDMTSESFAEVKYGQLDFCITVFDLDVFPSSYEPEILSRRALFDDRFVLVYSSKNELVAEPFAYDVFCKLPFVETRFGGNVISLVEERLRKKKEQPPTRVCVQSFQRAISMVGGTRMVTIAPARLVAKYKGLLDIKQAEAPLKLPMLSEYLYWHPRNDNDPGHCWLRKLILEVAADL